MIHQNEKCNLPQMFFIYIHKKNLATYIMNGLIYQICYDDEDARKNRDADILTEYPEYLVLNKSIKNIQFKDNVVLEVLLFPKEYGSLIEINGVFFYNTPLPISRLKTIYFYSKNDKEYLDNIQKTYKNCFIPENVIQKFIDDKFSIDEESKQSVSDEQTALNSPDKPDKKFKNKIMDSIKKFDRVLGVMAFMKNTSHYYTCNNNHFLEFSRYYFFILNLMDDKIPKSLLEDLPNEEIISGKVMLLKGICESILNVKNGRKTSYSKYPMNLLNELVDIIYKGETFDRETTKRVLEQNLKKEELSKRKEIQTSFDFLFDDSYDNAIKYLYKNRAYWDYMLLAILHKYQTKASHNIEGIKEDFHSTFYCEDIRSSLILAVLGLYFGYAKLPKDEEIHSFNEGFTKLFGKRHPIKFTKLEKFERLSIETVYQFIFSQKRKKVSFYIEFLDAFQENDSCTSFFNKNVPKYSDKNDLYIVIDNSITIPGFGRKGHYEVVLLKDCFIDDNVFSRIMKNDSFVQLMQNYLINRVKTEYKKIHKSHFLILALFQNNVPYTINVSSNHSEIGFSKNDIEQFIKTVKKWEIFFTLFSHMELDRINSENKLKAMIFQN